jgi:hypothetical protein
MGATLLAGMLAGMLAEWHVGEESVEVLVLVEEYRPNPDQLWKRQCYRECTAPL